MPNVLSLSLILVTTIFPVAQPSPQKPVSVDLENLTWVEAEKVLKTHEVVLVALGARTKEHGPHLLLKNDYLLAEYYKSGWRAKSRSSFCRLWNTATIPAFLEYPGSVSIGAETFKAMVMDICRSMSRYGPQKFYVLNTGISTVGPLKAAAEELNMAGLILRYLNLSDVDKKLPAGLLSEEGGTHADEAETSEMLYIAPETVDMSKAVKDYDPRPNRKGLTRDPKGPGVYSPTGIWGDPTLATKEKGRIIVETTVKEIVAQVNELIRLKIEK